MMLVIMIMTMIMIIKTIFFNDDIKNNDIDDNLMM